MEYLFDSLPENGMNEEEWFACCISLAEMAVVAVFLWLLRDFASSNRNCCRSIVAESGLIPHIHLFTRPQEPKCVIKQAYKLQVPVSNNPCYAKGGVAILLSLSSSMERLR